MVYNIADLSFVDDVTYCINYITYQENPYDHIQQGNTIVDWDDISDFCVDFKRFLSVDDNGVAINPECAVLDENGIPQYLIGSFDNN